MPELRYKYAVGSVVYKDGLSYKVMSVRTSSTYSCPLYDVRAAGRGDVGLLSWPESMLTDKKPLSDLVITAEQRIKYADMLQDYTYDAVGDDQDRYYALIKLLRGE